MTANKRGASFIVLGRRKLDAQSAEFDIGIETEAWVKRQKKWLYGPKYLSVTYSLTVKVNDESGEDGAPYPAAQIIPVFRAANGRHPFISELAGLSVDDKNDWEAWYGNDAPRLESNLLKFGSWNPKRGTLDVEWRATYSEGSAVKSFRFVGSPVFKGVSLKVKDLADADAFVTQVFGSDYRARLGKRIGRQIDYGEDFPADRRRWRSVTFVPKPLR
jgi:hypothetical protein